MSIIRIAVADDHQLVRTGLAQILNSFDDFHVVAEASNGQELLDQMDEARPNVVLLDLEMPVLDGTKTLEHLLRDYPEVKVLILTMHRHDSFIVHLMEMGASGYLIKDTNPQEVVTAIRTVMDEGLYFNNRVSKALLAGLPGNKAIQTSPQLPGNTLSSRELDVLRFICEEYTTAQIADKMFLSPKTIEGYRKALLVKTGKKNAAGLAIYAIKNGLI